MADPKDPADTVSPRGWLLVRIALWAGILVLIYRLGSHAYVTWRLAQAGHPDWHEVSWLATQVFLHGQLLAVCVVDAALLYGMACYSRVAAGLRILMTVLGAVMKTLAIISVGGYCSWQVLLPGLVYLIFDGLGLAGCVLVQASFRTALAGTGPQPSAPADVRGVQV